MLWLQGDFEQGACENRWVLLVVIRSGVDDTALA